MVWLSPHTFLIFFLLSFPVTLENSQSLLLHLRLSPFLSLHDGCHALPGLCTTCVAPGPGQLVFQLLFPPLLWGSTSLLVLDTFQTTSPSTPWFCAHMEATIRCYFWLLIHVIDLGLLMRMRIINPHWMTIMNSIIYWVLHSLTVLLGCKWLLFPFQKYIIIIL